MILNDSGRFVSEARQHFFQLQVRRDAAGAPELSLDSRPAVAIVGTDLSILRDMY